MIPDNLVRLEENESRQNSRISSGKIVKLDMYADPKKTFPNNLGKLE